MKSKETYHHGDLRDALIRIGLQRLRRRGAETFSLREAARDIGVTPGAAYNHFADKDQYLAAVALEARKLLARRTLKAASELSGLNRLEAVLRVYIEFASAEPLLFRLAFGRFGAASAQDPMATAEVSDVPSSHEQLCAALRGVQSGRKMELDDGVLALTWSVAHGAASLISDGIWKKNDPRANAALRLTVELAMHGTPSETHKINQSV
jgi:AcrR family transcriptional regulator